MKILLIFTLLGLFTFLTSCNKTEQKSNSKTNEIAIVQDTIRVSVAAIKPKAETDKFIFNAMDLFSSETGDVVNAIATNNYESALKKTQYYFIKNNSKCTETQKANFRFLHIYTLAGLVIQKKKTREELENTLNKYKGKKFISLRTPILEGERMGFNIIQTEETPTDTLKLAYNDQKTFFINCFTNFQLVNSFDGNIHKNKHAYIVGTLNDFDLSGEEISSWITQLNFSICTVKILEDELKKQSS